MLLVLTLLALYGSMSPSPGKAGSAAPYEFTYADPVGHFGRMEFNFKEGTAVVGDVGSRLLPCPGGFKCLAGGGINFTLPDSPREE